MKDVYTNVVCVDANVVLEGRPLAQQPWSEIDSDGKILVLFVPQVLKEIDSKKRDGRLSKHARDFNRLIAPAAESGQPQRICESRPTVDIAIAVTKQIDWAKLDDLDPDEPDARVVAQVLNEKSTAFEDRLFLSHDINPISMATRHGLRVKRMPDSWLRAPESSPDQKKINKLESRVRELETTEPNLEVLVEFKGEPPFEHIVIPDLSPTEKASLQSAILGEHQRIAQGGASVMASFQPIDTGYNGKYDTWRNAIVPRFLDRFAEDTNQMFAQIPVRLKLTNKGAVQAESLVLNVKIVGGSLSERWNIVPHYPLPPKPQPYSPLDNLHAYSGLHDIISDRVGRHDMHFDLEEDGSSELEVHCEDFRHERTWAYDTILTVEHERSDDVIVVVTSTASNMRGKKEFIFKLSHQAVPVDTSQAYDASEQRFVADRPMEDELKEAIQSQNLDGFHLIEYDK